MTKKITVLIVEDEPLLAELYVEFIKRDLFYQAVGVASTLEDAKLAIKKLKPNLILLDNYLPDGKGIDLLPYIATHQISSHVIFITAASDMDTCSKAIRYGAFDYLIKPVSYERLKYSLNRFDLYVDRQQSHAPLNQRRVDELYNLHIKDFADSIRHTKGIEEITLQKVQSLFNYSVELKAEEVAEQVGISKTTARRYLVYCVQLRFLSVKVRHGKVGRPERIYRRMA